MIKAGRKNSCQDYVEPVLSSMQVNKIDKENTYLCQLLVTNILKKYFFKKNIGNKFDLIVCIIKNLNFLYSFR